ncbi:unnamed protein product [Brachionus calyciflorus]|uniref:Kinesin-like protein n=1 Tax=Brachionus calyciflorus TaxID=104777 RepID=A0A814KTZ7_9BILA|nr:unnamed protein product [Brachionus calyciflorus]
MPKKTNAKDESVKVVVRCRPMEKKEIAGNYERIVEMDTKRGSITIKKPNAPEENKEFSYDAVYDWNSKQVDLYEETFRPLVESVLDGFNGTIFAYGQTGTGKTFTMEGVRSNKELRGVIPNSFDHIFAHISRSNDEQYLVRAQYLEIYQEEIRDLLSKDQSKRLELKESPDKGVYVKDLSAFITKNENEIEHVMNVGNQNRSVGATNMNEHSSRSHAIFIITIECSQIGADGDAHIRVGKLNLVDLAGSERQAKTGASGTRLKEATKINLSLSALGNVISALVDEKSTHIPYRDSKLTRLLQDSLGGNSKTVMVATIGPASYNYEETITTLRYANRAKNIKNKPKINEDPKDAMLRQFQEEILRIKAILDKQGGPKKSKKGKKSKQRVNEDGEVEYDDDPEDIEEVMKREQEKLNQEKQGILNDKNLIASEKEQMLREMKEKEKELERQQEAKLQMMNKLKAMESKLLSGKNIVDHTNEQERKLQERRAILAEEKRKEREMLQLLEKQEENFMEKNVSYSNLQQEVDDKTKKLKKYFAKFQQLKQEIKDLNETNAKERQELETAQSELLKDLKLRQLIIENFVPKDEREKLMNRLYYDPDEDKWKQKVITKESTKSEQELQMAKRPISAYGLNRAVTNFARSASQSLNPRFMGENVLFLELDMPNRTTRDYESPTLAPHLQAALDTALKDEEDIEIDEPKAKQKAKKAGRKKSSNKREMRNQYDYE